jgi:hypothetical protein
MERKWDDGVCTAMAAICLAAFATALLVALLTGCSHVGLHLRSAQVEQQPGLGTGGFPGVIPHVPAPSVLLEQGGRR